MRKTKIFVLLVMVLLCLNNVLTVSAAGQESIEEYVEDFRSETKCGSVSVVVVNGEETEFYGDEKGDYYSGWEMFENDVIGHSGGTPNYSSRIVCSDKEDIGVCVLTNMNVAASTDGLCNGIYLMAAGGKADKLPMDVWTVFDLIFFAVSAAGILMMVLMLKTKKHGVIIGIGMTALILLIAVCTVMPAVFGAGLKEILFT